MDGRQGNMYAGRCFKVDKRSLLPFEVSRALIIALSSHAVICGKPTLAPGANSSMTHSRSITEYSRKEGEEAASRHPACV